MGPKILRTSHVSILPESVHEDEDEDVERDQVDDEHVAAPRGNLEK